MKYLKFKLIIILLLNATKLFSAGEQSPNVECMFAYSVGKSQECYDWYKEVAVKDIEHLQKKGALFKKCIISNCGDLYFDENDPNQKENSYQYRFLEKKQCKEIVDLRLSSDDMLPTYFFEGLQNDKDERVEYAKEYGSSYVKTVTSVPYRMTRLACPGQEIEQCVENNTGFQYPVMCFKDKAGTQENIKDLLTLCIEGKDEEACANPTVKKITQGNLRQVISWIYCDEDKDGDFFPERISDSLRATLSSNNISCPLDAQCKNNKICSVTATCIDPGEIKKEGYEAKKCSNIGREYEDFVVDIGCNAVSDIYRENPKCARINSVEQGRDRNQTKEIHIKSQRSGALDDYVEFISYRKYPDVNYSNANITEDEVRSAPKITKEIFMAYFNPYDYKEVKTGPSWLGVIIVAIVAIVLIVVSLGTALIVYAIVVAVVAVVAAVAYTLIANPPGTWTDKTNIVDPGIMERTVRMNYTVNSYDRDHATENITFKTWKKSGIWKKTTTTVYMGVQYNVQLVRNLGIMGKDSGMIYTHDPEVHPLEDPWLSTEYWKWNERVPYRIDYGFDANLTVTSYDAEVIGIYNINNASLGAEYPEVQIKTIANVQEACHDVDKLFGIIPTGYPPLLPEIKDNISPKKSISSMGLIIPFNGCYTFKFYKSDLKYEVESIDKNFEKPFVAENLVRVDSVGDQHPKTCEDLWIDEGYSPKFLNWYGNEGNLTQAYAAEPPTDGTSPYNLQCLSGYVFNHCAGVTAGGECAIDDGDGGYVVGSKESAEPQTPEYAPFPLNSNLKPAGNRSLEIHPNYNFERMVVDPITIRCSCSAKRGLMVGDPDELESLFVRTKCFYPGDSYPVTLTMFEDSFDNFSDLYTNETDEIIDDYTEKNIIDANDAINAYTSELIDGFAHVNSMKFILEEFDNLKSEEPNILDNNYKYRIELDNKDKYINYNIKDTLALDALIGIKSYIEALPHIKEFVNDRENMPNDYPTWGCNVSMEAPVAAPPGNQSDVLRMNRYASGIVPFLENQGCTGAINYTNASIKKGATDCEFKIFALKTAMCNLYNKDVADQFEDELANEVVTFIDDRFKEAERLAEIVYNDFPKVENKVAEILLPSSSYDTPSYESGTQESNLLFKSASNCGDYEAAKIELANVYADDVDSFTLVNYNPKLLEIVSGLSGVVENHLDDVGLEYKYNEISSKGKSTWVVEDGLGVKTDQSCEGVYTWYQSNDSSNNGGTYEIKSTSGAFSSFGEYLCDEEELNSNGSEDTRCKSAPNANETNLVHDYETSTDGTGYWNTTAKRINSNTTREEIIDKYFNIWMQENRFINGYGDVDPNDITKGKYYQNVLLHYKTADPIVKKFADAFIFDAVKSYVTKKADALFTAVNKAAIDSDIDSNISVELDKVVSDKMQNAFDKGLVEGDFAPFNFIKIIDVLDDEHTVDKEILTPGGLLIKEPNNFYVTVAAMNEIREYRCYGDWNDCIHDDDDTCKLDIDQKPNPKFTARVTDFDGKNIPILKDEYYKCWSSFKIKTCNQYSYNEKCSSFNFPDADKQDYDEISFARDFAINMSQLLAFNELPHLFGAEKLRCESGYFWDFSWMTDPMFYLQALSGVTADEFSADSDIGDSIDAWSKNNVDYSTCASSWASYMIEAGCGPLDVAGQILESEDISEWDDLQKRFKRSCNTRDESNEATRKVRYTNAGCSDFANPLGYDLSEDQEDSINGSLAEELGPFQEITEDGIKYMEYAEYLGPLEAAVSRVVLKLLTDTFLNCNQCSNLECAERFPTDEAEQVYKLTNGLSELSHYTGYEYGLGDNDFGGPDYDFEMYGNCIYKGEECSKKILGSCVRTGFDYCCYNNRLSTVLVGQIYKQMGWNYVDDGCKKVELETLGEISWEPCKQNEHPSKNNKCINYKAFQDYMLNRIDWSMTKTMDLSETLDMYIESSKMREY